MKSKVYITLFLCLIFTLLTTIDVEHNRVLIKKKLKLEPENFTLAETGLYEANELEDYQYLFFTNDFSEVKGYNGKTNVAVFIDSTFAIKELKIVETEDTRNYVRRVKSKRFLNQFKQFGYNQKVKIVTGATITSDAVVASIRKSIEKIKTMN